MRSFIDCIPCMFEQAIRSARMVGLDDASVHELISTIGGGLRDFDPALSPPVNARVVYHTLSELSGLADPFEQAKHKHTELAMSLVPIMHRWLENADDTLDAAIRIAAAGNILDLGATADPGDVEGVLQRALDSHHELWHIGELRKALASARSILVVCDNAGEVVFDRVMLETVATLYPRAEIVAAVRSAPIINDAIIADALAAGLDRVAKVMSTGCALPGVDMDEVSQEFQDIYTSADVVIAKGQGNYETMNELSRTIFFILTVKCHVVAAHIGAPQGSSVLIRS